MNLEANNDQQTNTKQPKWLRRLERESWQAELIISGLAIFGCFKIPDFIFSVIDFLITHLSVDHYEMASMVAWMLILGACLLTTIFILHFILRGYWIALIGLNSVFPEGYKMEGGFYSSSYMKIITEGLPSIRESIVSIDKKCSTLFAGAYVFVMIYTSFALLLGGLLFLAGFLDDYIGKELALLPIYIYGGFMIIMSIISMIFNTKKLKSNPTIQAKYARIVKKMTPFITPGISQPALQINLTFYSYFEKKKDLLGLAFIVVTAVFYSANLMNKSNVEVLIRGEEHYKYMASEDIMRKDFYLDQVSSSSQVVTPVLPSEINSGPFLRLFIPVFSSEEKYQVALCGHYKKLDTLSLTENRLAKWSFRTKCYQQYIKVSINNQPIDLELITHRLNHKSERGVLAHIPTDKFIHGKNTLTIAKLESENKPNVVFRIPFWFDTGR